MGKTIAEKILSKHANKDLKTGDFAVCKVDFCFSQDGTSAIVIDRIRALGLKSLPNKNKFGMVIDHSAPSPTQGVSAVHKKMRQFSQEFDTILYDIGCGVCHQIIPEKGHVLPGDLVLGADSHTCTYGALGVFSTGVGSTDLAIAAASGKSWFKVPETIKIIIKGTLPKGVFAKDVILYIIGDLTSRGATYKAIEFYGDTTERMDMDGRFTMCNMLVELGAKCGFMQVDKKTLAWFKNRGININRKTEVIKADFDASYSQIKEYNVSRLMPQIAKPHTVDNVSSINELKGMKINEAFLGTCTNGRLEDLKIAARILKNKKINKDVKFILAPASAGIYQEALKLGLIEIFVKSGVAVVCPGCGPCVGTHNGIPSDGEVVLSTANRNFKGRMGNPDAFIYLASPATVAASALEGKITNPKKYLK